MTPGQGPILLRCSASIGQDVLVIRHEVLQPGFEYAIARPGKGCWRWRVLPQAQVAENLADDLGVVNQRDNAHGILAHPVVIEIRRSR